MDETKLINDLKDQIKFEQFVNSFYLDLILHSLIQDDYYYYIIELIRELKNASKDDKELNTNLKNLPGTVYEMLKKGELEQYNIT